MYLYAIRAADDTMFPTLHPGGLAVVAPLVGKTPGDGELVVDSEEPFGRAPVNMGFANAVTSALLQCGVKVIERPAMLTGYTEMRGDASGYSLAGGALTSGTKVGGLGFSGAGGRPKPPLRRPISSISTGSPKPIISWSPSRLAPG